MKITNSLEVIIYSDKSGKRPFLKWLDSLDMSIRKRVEYRVLRLSLGNYGDFKFLSNNIYELRLDFGPGYRIYFGKDGSRIVVLISGGDKKTQKKDIEGAKEYWLDDMENKNG